MKIAQRHLARYTDLPGEPQKLRFLLDDLGLEVKRCEEEGRYGAVLTLELLANRGDHHCYAGVARELTSRTGGPLRLPEIAALETGPAPVPLRIESDRCLVYTLTLLERAPGAEAQLPADLLFPLVAAGMSPVSAPVDATNLSNVELGQPTHAFDADTLVGGVTVRDSRPGERAWPLFRAEPVEIPAGTLVIADDEKILAIAGVIGCEESKTTERTTRLLLESATFDPVAVRKASRALDVHTDSSARFERGADPTAPLIGAGRVTWLLERYAGWRRVGATGEAGDWRDPRRLIPLEISGAASFLVHPLTDEEIRERLGRLGFAVSPPWPDWTEDEGWPTPPSLGETSRERLRNTLLVRVPPWRLWDVAYADDLYEELAKSIGYNETPEALPPVDMGALPTPREARKRRIEEVLVGNGFYEVFTDGFYGRVVRERLGLTEAHPLWAHVETTNALDRGYSLLKNNALAQAVDTVAQNVNRKNARVRAYEWTRTFHPDPAAENGVCRERRLLWLVSCTPDASDDWSKPDSSDVWHLSGLVREIGVELGLQLALGPADPRQPLHGALHPNRQATVRVGERVVGVLGEVHPSVVRAWKLKRVRPCYLELDADAVLGLGPVKRAYEEPTAHHPVVRNLAFTLPRGVTAGEVVARLVDCGPAWLERVDVVDVFAHEDAGLRVSTVTFELSFAADGGSRTAEEVNAVCEYLVKAVEKRFGDRGVKLR